MDGFVTFKPVMTTTKKKRVRSKKSFITMSVGERLRWLLVVRQLNQSEAATLCNISQATIANLVSDPKRKPNAKTLLSLAHALNTSPEFLLMGVGNPIRDSASQTDEEATLLTIFRKLDQRGRTNVLVFTRLMAELETKSRLGSTA